MSFLPENNVLTAPIAAGIPWIAMVVVGVFLALFALAGAGLLAAGLLRKKRGLWIAGLIALLLSCLCCAGVGGFAALSPQDGAPLISLPGVTKPTPTMLAVIPSLPTPSLEPTQETPPTPESTPTLAPAVLGEGPWWLLPSANELWVTNPDGSALTKVLDQGIYNSFLPRLIAPNGGRVAFISADPPGSYSGLKLNVLSLPGGEIQEIADLVSPEHELPEGFSPGEPAVEAVRAVVDGDSVAWSPDGSALAFMAVTETAFSDLYVYTFADGKTTRLSSLKSQGIYPVWSPEGKQIAFVAIETMGTGAGYMVKGALVADVANKKVRNIYEISPRSGNEDILYWVSETALLVDTWTMLCGRSDLRIFDLARAKPIRLWKNCYPDYGFALDPLNGTMLTYIDQSTADFENLSETGLMFVDANIPEAKFINQETGSYIIKFWPGPNIYSAASNTDISIIGTDGTISYTFPCPYEGCSPVVSLGGPSWADPGNNMDAALAGLWVGNLGSEGRKIFDKVVYRADWAPVTENLIFLTDEGVHFAGLDENFAPRLVSPAAPDFGTGIEMPLWVMP